MHIPVPKAAEILRPAAVCTNPVRVIRDCDAPPSPPPDPLHKRGRAERQSAVIGNTDSHLIILNSAFLIQKRG
jgi:hypothetical protein